MEPSKVIFHPMIALALWTGLVLCVTGYRRIGAVLRRTLRTSAFKLGESAEVPAHISVGNRNLMNLLEMPLLFYVVSICLYITHHESQGVLILAWAFVALRILHSIIHLTSNHILLRLGAFAASNLVLLALWIRFAMHIA